LTFQRCFTISILSIGNQNQKPPYISKLGQRLYNCCEAMGRNKSPLTQICLLPEVMVLAFLELWQDGAS
jgi:hypothetical protein